MNQVKVWIMLALEHTVDHTHSRQHTVDTHRDHTTQPHTRARVSVTTS